MKTNREYKTKISDGESLGRDVSQLHKVRILKKKKKTDLSASLQYFSARGKWGHDNQEGKETKDSSKIFRIQKL